MSVCQYPPCGKTIENRKSSAIYCSDSCKARNNEMLHSKPNFLAQKTVKINSFVSESDRQREMILTAEIENLEKIQKPILQKWKFADGLILDFEFNGSLPPDFLFSPPLPEPPTPPPPMSELPEPPMPPPPMVVSWGFSYSEDRYIKAKEKYASEVAAYNEKIRLADETRKKEYAEHQLILHWEAQPHSPEKDEFLRYKWVRFRPNFYKDGTWRNESKHAPKYVPKQDSYIAESEDYRTYEKE